MENDALTPSPDDQAQLEPASPIPNKPAERVTIDDLAKEILPNTTIEPIDNGFVLSVDVDYDGVTQKLKVGLRVGAFAGGRKAAKIGVKLTLFVGVVITLIQVLPRLLTLLT